MKEDSIHNIYHYLNNGLLDLNEYIDIKYPINSIFHCCNSYHTILSYSLKKTNINMSLVKKIIKNGGRLDIIFSDYTSPMFYLFKFQTIDVIREIIESNHIDIYNVSNFYYILYTILMKNERDKWLYLTKRRYDILLSPTTINLSKGYFSINRGGKNVVNLQHKRIQIPKYQQQNWLIEDCLEIYYTMILMNYSTENRQFHQIPADIIKKIYLMLFI